MSDGLGYQPNLQRGRVLRQAGRYQDACKFLRVAIEADPEQPEAYIELALSESGLPGRQKESLLAIERAISLDPQSARALGYKAYVLSQARKHKEAITVGNGALAIEPTCYMALLAVANAETKLGHWSRAETAALCLLEHHPGDTSALNLLAQALRFQNRLRESREIVLRILAMVPNDAFGQTNAGYEALRAFDHRRANVHFLNALRVDPHLNHARLGLLQSLRERIWIYRANLKILSFCSETKKREALIKLAIIILTAFTAGLFLGLLILYLVLMFTLRPVSNLFLLFLPAGRHALTRREKGWAIFTAVMSCLILMLLVSLHLYGIEIIGIAYLLLFALGVYLPQWADLSRSKKEEKLGHA
jgi:tetratricopeptide (TPR) repeat protein